MPLVDRSIYFPPREGVSRRGFVVFCHRARPDPAAFPGWLTPHVRVCIQQPRSHAELAALYRESRAVVVFERTVAIFEALSCGCPVICIPGDNFEEATYQPRFRGTGLVWGWREDALEDAVARTSLFRARYDALESDLDARICGAFDWIMADACRRLAAGTAHDSRQAASV
jgi:glycosyltransferase involved in cell wall biosynthesis